MSKARQRLAAIREKADLGAFAGEYERDVPALLAVAEAALEYREAEAVHDFAQAQRDTISDDDLCRAIDRHSDAWLALNRALDALGE